MRFRFNLGDLVYCEGKEHEVVDRRLPSGVSTPVPQQKIYFVAGKFRAESELKSAIPCPKCKAKGYDRFNGCRFKCGKPRKQKLVATKIRKRHHQTPCISYRIDPNLLGTAPIETLPRSTSSEFTPDYDALHKKPNQPYSTRNYTRNSQQPTANWSTNIAGVSRREDR